MSPDIVQALVRTIELKDLSTAAHTWRVVLYTRLVAEHFGIKGDRLQNLTVGAALHDLGKIDIPDAVLQKPARLTEEEFAIIRKHPIYGHERLVSMGEDNPDILELVRHHHERVDGKGYPDGLTAAKVPPSARYFAVIDSFDAMTSLRPYRTEAGPQAAPAAIEELRSGIGTRYDGECVEAFIDLHRRGELDWILEYFNDTACTEPWGRNMAEDAARRRIKK